MRVVASTIHLPEGLQVCTQCGGATDSSKVNKMDSEGTMNKKLSFALLMALGAATVSATAAAQNTVPLNNRESARIEYGVYQPTQGATLLQQVDWDDRHRCDGDHDRDDRHCYGRRDDDRYRNQYYAPGNGYYGNAPVNSQGWYDQRGNGHSDPGGWYDRKGKWHSDKRNGHDER